VGGYCTPPREDYDFFGRDEFVITAWWPPTLQQVPLYKAAHFNLMLSGNIASSACQAGRTWGPSPKNATMPSPATETEAFECIMSVLPTITKLGLKVAFNTGHYNRSKTSYALGGEASYGGIVDAGPRDSNHYISDREVEWLVTELRRRNISSNEIAMVFLHDDDASVRGNTAHATDWLRTKANEFAPQVNTFPDSGPETLLHNRQFVFAPEEYAITGSNTSNASQKTMTQLSYYVNDQYLASRYRLDLWPLFALGDGGAIQDIASDSLVRWQVYAALAYGSRGLYYYCWGHGIVNWPAGTPGPNYPFVKVKNQTNKREHHLLSLKWLLLLFMLNDLMIDTFSIFFSQDCERRCAGMG